MKRHPSESSLLSGVNFALADNFDIRHPSESWNPATLLFKA